MIRSSSGIGLASPDSVQLEASEYIEIKLFDAIKITKFNEIKAISDIIPERYDSEIFLIIYSQKNVCL